MLSPGRQRTARWSGDLKTWHGAASTGEALTRLDPAAVARALERLRQAYAANLAEDGVWLDSRAWIITAVRRDQVCA
jgi:hypothetical protein